MPEPTSPGLARVMRGNLCSGCGGCAALAPGRIAMAPDARGFLRPRQTGALTAEEEARFARICPGLYQRVEAAGRRTHPLWGPYLEMLTGHATDAGLRHAGASGGGLSAVALHLLEAGVVDRVIQTSADPAAPLGNVTRVSVARDDVLEAAGSRYAPAAPLAGLRAQLVPGRRHAFVGKPCDVVALRALMADEPDLAEAIPVVLSFFCAGTPSLMGARRLIERMGARPEEVRSFRYRGMGWPGRATAELADGSTRSMSYHDSWGGVLSGHVQHRCRICADGTGVAADLVLADAWEADAAGYPLFEEAEGRSLIVVRTGRGAEILNAARAAGRIVTSPFAVEDLSAIQPGQRNRRYGLAARLLALRLLARPVPRYEGLDIWAAARLAGPRRFVRNFLGMLRRGLLRRL